MAQVKIVAVDKRIVTLDVAWEDGLSMAGVVVPDVPVEDFATAQAYLLNYVSGLYTQARAEADRMAYENPTPDPRVLAAVGHTFDEQGNVLS